MKHRVPFLRLFGLVLSLACAGPACSGLCAAAAAGPGGETGPTPLPPVPLTEAVTAAGRGLATDFKSRLDAIGRLGCHLAASDLAVLYRYLLDPANEPGLLPGQSYALKNDVLNALRAQSQPPPDLARLLIGLYRSGAQPAVMRDYALQHMAPWYSRADAGERADLTATLEAASRDFSQSRAGTALLALVRIQRENPTACVNPVNNQVFALLHDDGANLCPRITAAQLCGLLRIVSAAPDLAELAMDRRQPPILRLAAAASLRSLAPAGGPVVAAPAPPGDGCPAPQALSTARPERLSIGGKLAKPKNL